MPLGTRGVFLMRIPVANSQLLGPVPEKLNSFKGPHGANAGISRNYLYLLPGTFPLLFRLFFHTPFFHLFVPKHSPEGSQKVSKIMKIYKKTSTRSSLETIPAKSTSKVWKSYPLQRFKPISKGPGYPKKHRQLDPKWTPELQIVRKIGTQKNNKKQAAKKSSKAAK